MKTPLVMWVAMGVAALIVTAMLLDKDWLHAGGLIAVFVIFFLVARRHRLRR